MQDRVRDLKILMRRESDTLQRAMVEADDILTLLNTDPGAPLIRAVGAKHEATLSAITQNLKVVGEALIEALKERGKDKGVDDELEKLIASVSDELNSGIQAGKEASKKIRTILSKKINRKVPGVFFLD